MKNAKNVLMTMIFLALSCIAEELVKNGNFESGNLDGWHHPMRGGQGQELQVIQPNSKYGKYCLKVSGDPAGRYNSNLWMQQRISPLKQGVEYHISFTAQAHVKNVGDKYFQISVCQERANGNSIVYTGPKIDFGHNEWADYDYSFKPHPEAVGYVFFISAHNLELDDYVLVDNISLEKSPELQVPEGELIKNGNFETGNFKCWNWPLRGSKGQELQFISKKTDYGRYCLKVTGDPAGKYNSNLWMSQSVPVLKQKTEYVISFRGKAKIKGLSTSKMVKVSICQMFPNGATITYSGPTVDLTRPTWTHYEVRFVPDNRAVLYAAYIAASNLDVDDEVFIDDVSLREVRDLASPFDPALPAQGAVDTITRGEYTYTLDKTTGVMTSLVINGEVFQPRAKDSGVIYVQTTNQEYILDGKENASSHVPFKAKADYQIIDGMLRETITFTATADANGPFKLGIRHGINPKDFKRIINSLHPVRVTDIKDSTIFSYNKAPNDKNLSRLDVFQYASLPMSFIESKNSYLMAGSLLLDDYVTCSPNTPMNTFPSLQRNPLSVKKGDIFVIEVNYKRFDRRVCLPRDVWRFYCDHTRTNLEILKPFIPPVYTEPRAFYPGNFCAHTFFEQSREDRLFPGSNIWFYSWHDLVNERYPIKGEWYCEGKASKHKAFQKTSAEEVRDHIAHLQAQGHKCALYFRGLAPARLCGTTYPKSWYYNPESVTLALYGGGAGLALPEHMAKEVGFNKHKWADFDFNSEEYRQFFLKELLDAVNYYKPMAIGWDCMVGRLDQLAMTAIIYDYARKHNMPLKFEINEGSPLNQAYNDQVTIENGFLAGRTSIDFELLRAYTTTIDCEERYNLFDDAIAFYFDKTTTWLSPGGLAINARYVDYLLSTKPELKQNRKKISQLCQLRASLYDVGHGSCAGYMEEANPVPPALQQFCNDIAGLILVNKSFALRLPSGADMDDFHFTAAWCDQKALRLMLWNDDSKPYPVNLKIDRKHFAAQGWNLEAFKKGKYFLVKPEGSEPTTVTVAADDQFLTLTGNLPPFAGFMLFADK